MMPRVNPDQVPLPPHFTVNELSNDDLVVAERLVFAYQAILDELGKAIVGHREVIHQLLIALFAQGHCLFVGVPGLGKTLLVKTLAQILDLHFSRIQFTPDLMPSDITGTDIIQEDPDTGHRCYQFIRGPVFANIILADEINRTPPKTQSALLQAMQELQVTAGGHTHPLQSPLLVLATQNPIEQEGTYPLPEAQLDRFMFNIRVEYPSADEEAAIVATTTSAEQPNVEKVLSRSEILRFQRLVRDVPVSEHVVNHAVGLVRATRPDVHGASSYIREMVQWGAGPRAAQALILGGKARALLEGRYAVSREDVKALALPVLRHRIIPTFHAEAELVDTDTIIRQLLDEHDQGGKT